MRLKLLTLILLLLQPTAVVLALTADRRSKSESMATKPLSVRDRMAQPQKETYYRFQVSNARWHEQCWYKRLANTPNGHSAAYSDAVGWSRATVG